MKNKYNTTALSSWGLGGVGGGEVTGLHAFLLVQMCFDVFCDVGKDDKNASKPVERHFKVAQQAEK